MQPLADPSIWGQLPKLLLSRTSPLKLRPQLDPQQWRWGLDFLGGLQRADLAQHHRAAAGAGVRSRAGFEAMRADAAAGLRLLRHRQAGDLPQRRRRSTARARQVELQRELGSAPQRIVTPDECIAIEPALAGYRATRSPARSTRPANARPTA